jgi:hypothetical protein
MSASTELNRQTEQEIMDYLLTLAEAGRELVAGLKKIPVAYDPRVDEDGNLTDDPQPFVDLETGHRYPPRQVYAALVKSGRN